MLDNKTICPQYSRVFRQIVGKGLLQEAQNVKGSKGKYKKQRRLLFLKREREERWRRMEEEEFIAQLGEALVKLICKHNQKEIAVEAMLEIKKNKSKSESKSKWE